MIAYDARALAFIQIQSQMRFFLRLQFKIRPNATWDSLKQEYREDSQVRSVKLQGIRQDFEYVRMKNNKSLSAYLTRLIGLINLSKNV